MRRRVTLAGVLLLAAGCHGNQNVFNPAGPAADAIADLGWFLTVVCLTVYGLVVVTLLWAVVRQPRDQDDSAATERRLHLVIAIAVGTTVCVLVGLTASSVAAGRHLYPGRGQRGVHAIDVVGRQWWWDFQYRGPSLSDVVSSPNELHLPVGVPVALRARSQDVIHSFWAPNLHGKRDLIPGQETTLWLQADRVGTYRGQCAEFCGHQHARMAFLVVVEPAPQFEAWLRQQRRAAERPLERDAQRGEAIFLGGACASCHPVRGTSALAQAGPDLTHLASRAMLAAATLPNTREHLREWLDRTQDVKPGARMPAHLVPARDRDALVAYLRSLR
jgi:cytochrome c oxidase subunit II